MGTPATDGEGGLPAADVFDRRFAAPVSKLAGELAANFRPPKIPIRRADLVNDLLIKDTPLDELFAKLAGFRDNPAGFVHWAFPWGEPGTDLEDQTGPEPWQLDQLNRIGDVIKAGGDMGCVLKEDVASGHGVGKSCQVSWLILWAISTGADTRGVVTANTDTQLKQKTWAELAKWYAMFIAKQLFTLTATSIFIAQDKERAKKWRIDQAPWSKENTEAFAGMHNRGKRLIVIFDEASSIDDKVYEVATGALSDANTEIFWFRYGNPTRTSGEFFKQSMAGSSSNARGNIVHNVVSVDSRSISFTNKEQLQEEIQEYGEDSDFVRVRIKGMFPRAGYDNFIAPGVVTDARRRRLQPLVYASHQKILAIDPARFGNDFSVLTLRQGLRVHSQVARRLRRSRGRYQGGRDHAQRRRRQLHRLRRDRQRRRPGFRAAAHARHAYADPGPVGAAGEGHETVFQPALRGLGHDEGMAGERLDPGR